MVSISNTGDLIQSTVYKSVGKAEEEKEEMMHKYLKAPDASKPVPMRLFLPLGRYECCHFRD